MIYPSSVFVEELPLNMGEYAAAKAAADVLCRFLEKSSPGIRFHHPPLPRLATDQTASLLPSDAPEATDVIVSLLRQIQTPSITEALP